SATTCRRSTRRCIAARSPRLRRRHLLRRHLHRPGHHRLSHRLALHGSRAPRRARVTRHLRLPRTVGATVLAYGDSTLAGGAAGTSGVNERRSLPRYVSLLKSPTAEIRRCPAPATFPPPSA